MKCFDWKFRAINQQLLRGQGREKNPVILIWNRRTVCVLLLRICLWLSLLASDIYCYHMEDHDLRAGDSSKCMEVK